MLENEVLFYSLSSFFFFSPAQSRSFIDWYRIPDYAKSSRGEKTQTVSSFNEIECVDVDILQSGCQSSCTWCEIQAEYGCRISMLASNGNVMRFLVQRRRHKLHNAQFTSQFKYNVRFGRSLDRLLLHIAASKLYSKYYFACSVVVSRCPRAKSQTPPKRTKRTKRAKRTIKQITP